MFISHLAFAYLCSLLQRVYWCFRDIYLRLWRRLGSNGRNRPHWSQSSSFPDIDPDVIHIFVFDRCAVRGAIQCTVDAPSWCSGRRIALATPYRSISAWILMGLTSSFYLNIGVIYIFLFRLQLLYGLIVTTAASCELLPTLSHSLF